MNIEFGEVQLDSYDKVKLINVIPDPGAEFYAIQSQGRDIAHIICTPTGVLVRPLEASNKKGNFFVFRKAQDV